jgi:flagellar assembly factor FliW
LRIKIVTKPFGEIEIDEKQIVDFPEGILGFDFVKKYAVLDSDDDKSPFKWLQAVDEAGLAFVIIRPEDFMSSFRLRVSQNDIDAVGLEDKKDALVFAIVTIPENPSDMTANLQGPVIINPEKHLGRQAISLDDQHTVRHKILDEIKKSDEKEGK